MTIQLIPAIDMLDGKVVRLRQGDYKEITYYDQSVSELINHYEILGVNRLHIINLSAARESIASTFNPIINIPKKSSTLIQYGGGLKSIDSINLMTPHFNKLILGSILAKNLTQLTKLILSISAEKIIAAIDLRIPQNIIKDAVFCTHGWNNSSQIPVWDLVTELMNIGIKEFIFTDISKDGMLSGPNVDLYDYILNHYPDIVLQASGGISAIKDIEALDKIGVPFVISGKALLENKIQITEVSAFLQKD
jgi:phosphoribosylformimino-5-aminoimidazole carboxamide ribotide isomerase